MMVLCNDSAETRRLIETITRIINVVASAEELGEIERESMLSLLSEIQSNAYTGT